MTDAIWINAVLIVCVPLLVALFGFAEDRLKAFAFMTYVAIMISFWGWIVYAIIHFATKYW